MKPAAHVERYRSHALVAPITRGQEVGTLLVNVPNMAPAEYKLFAAEDVAELGLFTRTITKARLYLAGAP